MLILIRRLGESFLIGDFFRAISTWLMLGWCIAVIGVVASVALQDFKQR